MHERIIEIIRATHEPTNTGWRYISNRRQRTTDEIVSAVSTQLTQERRYDLLGELVDLPDWLAENLVSSEGTQQFQFVSPEDFIDAVMKNKNITISSTGNRITRQLGGLVKKDITSEDLLLMLKSELIDFNRPRPARLRLKDKDVEIKLYDRLLRASHKQLLAVSRDMYHLPDKVSILEKWLEDLHTILVIKEPLSVWKMMIKHVMWIIKRQMYSKKVINDIWIQIFGNQGTGKTYVARYVLFKVLRDFYCETELSKIEDFDREIEKFTKSLVVNFDEVALGQSNDPNYRINRRQLNNLKSLLTREVFTVRVMRTQKQVELAKSFTAFSTANTHLYDVIFDDTGMRRFFEFNSEQPTDTQFNHDEITRLSELSKEAWQGIDEELEKGYWDKSSEEGKYVFNAQQSYFPTHSTVAMWVSDCKVVAGDTTLDDAYSDYQTYCRHSGNNYVSTKQGFVKDMMHLCKPLINDRGGLLISYEVE